MFLIIKNFLMLIIFTQVKILFFKYKNSNIFEKSSSGIYRRLVNNTIGHWQRLILLTKNRKNKKIINVLVDVWCVIDT